MTENKLFEIRDRATFIPVLVTKICSGMDEVGEYFTPDPQAEKLIRRAGFGDHPLYIYHPLAGCGETMATYDPYEWSRSIRTHHIAHLHIQEHFESLPDGSVIDVEFILGETETKKESELK